MKCIIDSEKITVITLDKIFRQAAKSKIVLNAHKVNSGEYFVDGENKELNNDFYFIEETNPEKIVNCILSLYKEGFRKIDGYESFKSIQIITPSKKGTIGTKELNKKIQKILNPEAKGRKEKASGRNNF